MKFEEILEPLKNGKKVRRQIWGGNNYCQFVNGLLRYYEVETDHIHEEINYSFIWGEITAADWELYVPILTDKEKEYLNAVIRPFKDKIKSVCKISLSDCCYLRFTYESDIHADTTDCFGLPYFKSYSMYLSMKLNKEYTLEELDL